MFWSRRRRFPAFGLSLFVLGFLIASAFAGSGVGTGVGLLLFLPFLAFKFFFFLMFVGFAARFFSRGRHRGRRQPRPPSTEEREWDSHMRVARKEVDDLDIL